MEIVLKNAIILSPDAPYSFSRSDVLISNNKINKIKKSINAKGAEKTDCTGKILLPGLINAHTHAPMSLLRGVGDDLQLNEWMKKEMWPREKKLSPSDIKTGALLAIAEMIRSGITTFNDHYFHMDSVASAVSSANMRSVLGYSMIDMGDFSGKGISELKIAKQFAQKISTSHSPLLTPSINPHAPATCSPQLLKHSAQLAKEFGCILHTHASETKEEVEFTLKNYKKHPIEFLNKCNCLASNTVLAHGVHATAHEISLIANAGSSVAHCPVANLKLASGIAPIPKYLNAKANLAIGTDGAASNNNLDLFESMKLGALIQKNSNSNAAAVKAGDYLHMATAGGASALKLNAGKIKEGCLADLTFLDASSPNLIPFTNNAGWLVYSTGPQNVCDVMINGKWVMKNKKLLTINEKKVIKDAQKIADRIN
ncbi:MAG: amidohydrolase [Candidatus Micrarchaeota archaeon]